MTTYDVAIIGGGIAGMATAARLQAVGLSTIVCEAHSKIGGCAGYFRRHGFAFDVGATTLVDFKAGGVGAELLDSINMPVEGDVLSRYTVWLPDRCVTLHHDSRLWAEERLRAFGDTPAHRQFWEFLDGIAHVFWDASRQGIKLPLQSPSDIFHNIQLVGVKNLHLTRYLMWTMGDALRAYRLRDDKALVGLLSMLIEDTVHSTIDSAPLINSALGVTIRDAGLMRYSGGMYGFWTQFGKHYCALGGEIRLKHRVKHIKGQMGEFTIQLTTANGAPAEISARRVVSAIPAEVTECIAPNIIRKRIRRKVKRDAQSQGGAIVVFLGVSESEVEDQASTHHQLLQDYDAPFLNGNNMFVSVSQPYDTLSAPTGYRAVMISTHCDVSEWEDVADYEHQKHAIGEKLLANARQIYPRLGNKPRVYEVATPRTYATFTGRPNGAVGGVRQTRWNSNQFAIPHDIGVPGFWLVGDTTFPGLGTVACVLGSRLVANKVLQTV